MQIHAHMYTQAHMHTPMHVHIHMHTHMMYTYTHTFSTTDIYIKIRSSIINFQDINNKKQKGKKKHRTNTPKHKSELMHDKDT